MIYYIILILVFPALGTSHGKYTYSTSNLEEDIQWSNKVLKRLPDQRNEHRNLEEYIHNALKRLESKIGAKRHEITNSNYEKAMALLKSGHSKKAYSILLSESDKGHVKSMEQIAWGLLLGCSLGQDFTKARNLFMNLTDQGDADGHAGLGLIYSAGLGVESDRTLGMVHFILGSAAGNLYATMAIGNSYTSRDATSLNCEKALIYYRLAAQMVVKSSKISNPPYYHPVKLLEKEENPSETFGVISRDLYEYHKLMADRGDLDSQLGLGQLHYDGARGVAKDLDKSLYFFRKAAKYGNLYAYAFIGLIYLEGTQTEKIDYKTALNCFNKAAAKDNPIANYGLGLMNYHGIDRKVNYEEARKRFSLSANFGWPGSYLYLGIMSLFGEGMAPHPLSSKSYLMMAARRKEILAYYYLGYILENGIGVPRSCSVAVSLYKYVSERGSWGKFMKQGYDYYTSSLYEYALATYMALSEIGYETAQTNAAFLFDKQYIDRNNPYELALFYWKKAAFQGNSPALVKIGDYHYYGLGTPVNYKDAITNYFQAYFTNRNPRAIFNAGYMFEKGLGVNKNLEYARICYEIAGTSSKKAAIPAELAILKLKFLPYIRYLTYFQYFLCTIQEISLILLTEKWDLCLISWLTACLGYLVYLRHPQQAQH